MIWFKCSLLNPIDKVIDIGKLIVTGVIYYF